MESTNSAWFMKNPRHFGGYADVTGCQRIIWEPRGSLWGTPLFF